MSEQMMPKTNTVNMDTRSTPRATTLKHIDFLSPSIDDSYSLSRSKMILTPDKINPNKKALPEIIKVLKLIMGKYLIPKSLIHMTNNQTTIKHQVEHFMMHLREKRIFLLIITKQKNKRNLMIWVTTSMKHCLQMCSTEC